MGGDAREDAPYPGSERQRTGGLVKRVISTLVLAPAVLAAIWYGPPASDLLVILSAGVLLWEWCRLVGMGFPGPATLLLSGGVIAALALAAMKLWPWPLALLAATAAASAAAAGRKAVWMAAGALYLGLPCLSFLWLRQRPEDGLEVVVWLLLVVWSLDIFAYLSGRSIGGPRLWPAVSPKKTWAGLIGGVAAAAAAGGLLALAAENRAPWELAALAAILGVVSQAGDLVESAVKRHFGVKDASGIIPGHGGLLDRVDGLLAASLALAAALWLALV